MTQAKTKTKAAAAAKPAGNTKAVAKFPDAADKPEAEAMAKFSLRPSVNAAVVMDEYTKPLGALDLGAVVDELADGIEKMNAGDMSRVEGMLYAQAHALQSIFMNFSRRALKQEYQRNLESFLRMALKAQNQCRMTLETLATIKNPPVVFAKQANINNGGQQQVNNGATPAAPATNHGETLEGVGGVESLQAPGMDTPRIPTQRVCAPLKEIQTDPRACPAPPRR